MDIKESPRNDRCYGPVHIVVDQAVDIRPGEVISFVLNENPCDMEFVRAISVNKVEGGEFEAIKED